MRNVTQTPKMVSLFVNLNRADLFNLKKERKLKEQTNLFYIKSSYVEMNSKKKYYNVTKFSLINFSNLLFPKRKIYIKKSNGI